MTNQHESIPDLMQEDTFEVVMRGYNRRQVHDYMIRTRNQVRDLEERLARAIDQAEQGRVELAEARRRMVEAPQSYEDLSPRLAQILRLGEEEAAAKKEDAEAEAVSVRDAAKSEADRLVTSARETADNMLTSAQSEAERRVGEATGAAERMLAQAGADAEEKLTSARTEAEDTLREARAEADSVLTSAKQEAEQLLESAGSEAERTLTSARTEAESTLESARQRAESLDEHAGRRVEYLSNTHTEVVRRLTEISSVLGDLMHTESKAGPLVIEPAGSPEPAPLEPADTVVQDAVVEEVVVEEPEHLPAPQDDVRVIVEDSPAERTAEVARPVSDDTDVDIIGRLSDVRR
ncbi:hypothetical protein [Nonomuraea sp. NEAU-A123]|uniref:hypothetical protein n=1 Tax=Nonomuraea sp. NEAU-A123 TaxID=2839649 RepID=UPI001BE4D49C|nr:hypothetical protein [Nonomuraea sp. NEAU-A123]MBT2233080.1 hypothetical protein [Nonomuraea sp. NEAU-A123]